LSNRALKGILIILFFWSVISGLSIIDRRFLATPWDIAISIVHLSISGELVSNLFFTIVRSLTSFAISILVGVPLGLLVGMFSNLRENLSFPIDFFRSIPAPSLFPLFLVFFGIGDMAKIACIVFACSFPILVQTTYGVLHCNHRRVRLMERMGFNRSQMLRKLIFPMSLPYIFVGLRNGLSLSLIATIVVEMTMPGNNGLGYATFNSYHVFKIPDMYAYIVITGFLGWFFNKLFLMIEKRKLFWGVNQVDKRMQSFLMNLRYVQDYVVRLKRPDFVPFLPSTIHLETTTKCNLSCLICPRTYMSTQPSSQEVDRWNKNMSLDEFKVVLNQFDRLRLVRLHGLGEPLMNPNLVDMVSVANDKGIEVDFTTNAVLLTSALSKELIKAGLSHLTVSLDGATFEGYEKIRVGANFNLVIENLFLLARNKQLLKKRIPELSINTVVTHMNISELPQILHLAKKLGARELRASLLEPVNEDMKDWIPDHVLWQEMIMKMHNLARKLRIDFDDHGSSQRHNYINQKLHNLSGSKRCFRPWVAPFIRIDGFLTPCCNISDWRVLGGINVFENDLFSLWNSEAYQQFRKQVKYGPLPAVCQHCPLA
jgi:ABC-type nitrate/sulfonate/bicarbonate transport system permease component/MoaA/NifB/PqqE/SkfB family radical SAM enzyme